ncbi:hypothetical protein SPICUR_04130 [Spiribacter curvatus]|uniref:Type IV pilus biogenesis protein PilP n=1 Tax=Spiribacter curvatus TaxID=1335757 RepID=U5T2Z9_9GAMM|nr:hypothetical protein [Spiribacter curvatus]AGY91810.1 hypothetical protein SPICUR_04130 [Spiribacter curvatus]
MQRPKSTNGAGTTRLAVLIAVMAAPVAAQQTALDPTAPPAVLQEAIRQAERQIDEAASENAGPSADETQAPPPSPTELTLIVEEAIHGQWRRRAVIGGRVVTADAETEAGVIERIGRSSVEITNESGTGTRSITGGDITRETPDRRIKE